MTTYAYDGAGNLISQAVSATDGGAAGTTTTTDWTYDAADQVTSEVQDATPSTGSSSSGYLNRTTAYTYDADNDVLSKTVGTGSALAVTDYGYNTAGNMTSQSVQDGSTTPETTWTYDQNGLPLSMTTPAGNASGADAADYTTNYAYNQAGQLTAETGPPVSVSSYTSQTATSTRPQTSYGYDTFGDQTQAVDPDGNVTTTAYDGDGRGTSVTQAPYTPPGASSAITATTAYAYDEDGNLVSEYRSRGPRHLRHLRRPRRRHLRRRAAAAGPVIARDVEVCLRRRRRATVGDRSPRQRHQADLRLLRERRDVHRPDEQHH